VLGLMLRDRLDALGVDAEIRYPGDGLRGEASLQEMILRAITPSLVTQ